MKDSCPSSMFPLPKQTPAGYTIYYSGLIDTNPDRYNFTSLIKLFDMIISLDLKERGSSKGHLIVVDFNGFTLTHFLKISIMPVKKYMFFLQEALPVRLKGLHYVNAVSFMDKVLGLVKPFMKKDLIEMLQVHSGKNETLYEVIPRECLPEELGGSCGNVKQLHEKYAKHVRENADYFIKEEASVVDETQRPGKPKNAGDLFGVEGTFKKLDID